MPPTLSTKLIKRNGSFSASLPPASEILSPSLLVSLQIDGPVVKIKISGPAASVMTVRGAVTQKLREKIPLIAAVQLL